VGWKMNRWEVGRGVLVKGESVHGGSCRMHESGNVSSEECGE